MSGKQNPALPASKPQAISALVTIYDVAARAQVSPKTVSRVVNNSALVSEDTKERVQLAIKELGYFPSPIARSLRTGRDSAIGVVVESFADPFFSAVIAGIRQVNQEKSPPLLVASTEGVPGQEALIVQAFVRRQVSGLILVPTDADQAYLCEVSRQIPVVLVDRPGTNIEVDTVLGDDAGAAARAVDHLAGRGHRRIALVVGPPTIITSTRRVTGYRQALVTNRIEFDPRLVLECATTQDAALALDHLLSLPSPPTAIFCANTKASLGIIPALHALHRTDVALVCFGDLPLASVVSPAIAVIDQNPSELGAIAGRLLAARITGARHGPAEVITVPTILVTRGAGERQGPF